MMFCFQLSLILFRTFENFNIKALLLIRLVGDSRSTSSFPDRSHFIEIIRLLYSAQLILMYDLIL